LASLTKFGEEQPRAERTLREIYSSAKVRRVPPRCSLLPRRGGDCGDGNRHRQLCAIYAELSHLKKVFSYETETCNPWLFIPFTRQKNLNCQNLNLQHQNPKNPNLQNQNYQNRNLPQLLLNFPSHKSNNHHSANTRY
jgi:hypothetical protein